jgi:hypothetical protein
VQDRNEHRLLVMSQRLKLIVLDLTQLFRER